MIRRQELHPSPLLALPRAQHHHSRVPLPLEQAQPTPEFLILPLQALDFSFSSPVLSLSLLLRAGELGLGFSLLGVEECLVFGFEGGEGFLEGAHFCFESCGGLLNAI
jgi:hypothetical protein